ncbi:MAG: pyruvate kinase [Gammaproteobacteria bacterium]
MVKKAHTDVAAGWDRAACDALIGELQVLRESMLEAQARLAPTLADIEPGWRPSAINLAHYLAMRRYDMRRLQDRLAWVGVSSLGRAETHALANVDKVLGLLHLLAGRVWANRAGDEPVGFRRGPALLDRHAEAVFGPPPTQRTVRIMVTLPTQAAADDALVAALIEGGMDIARINCAHDGPDAWVAMAKRVRQAARRIGRPVRILMDLAGPKLRTGPVAAGQPVLKVKPARNALGQVVAPALLGLRAVGSSAVVPGATWHVGVEPAWLDKARVGARVQCVDARGARRSFEVRARTATGVLLAGLQTTYLVGQTRLRLQRRGQQPVETGLGDLPPAVGRLHLKRGDTLLLTSGGPGRDAVPGADRRRAKPAMISCTLPEVFAQVRRGERIWFDDGRIGGVIRRASPKQLRVEITEARVGGETLPADKGINLPDSDLHLPALTARDIQDLATVARHADLIGLSFAQSAADVQALLGHLRALQAPGLGVILKIETRRGFEHLPEMLLAAMACASAGVMIARGDLAVECGYERLAEVQEEILWACEAAHMPVVWATQVLETLAKTGVPSRAEITDAAMGERAECVMLNKGPHILDALRTLDNILRRMQEHQTKKRPLLRALKSWSLAPALDAGLTPKPSRRSGSKKAD